MKFMSFATLLCGLVDLTQTASSACATKIGSIDRLWIANYEDLVSVTLTSGEVSAITLSGSNKMFNIVFSQNNTAFYNETPGDPGAVIENQLSMEFEGITAEKIAALNNMRGCCELFVVVKYKSGIKRVVGIDYDPDNTTWKKAVKPPQPKIGSQSGAAVTDYEKLTLEYIGQQQGLTMTCTMSDSALNAL
jgi:hypothetical protein